MTLTDSLSVEQRRRIHDICWQFETDWQDGKAPGIEDYVVQIDTTAREALLAELMIVELELRSSPDRDRSAEQSAADTQATDCGITQHCLNEFQRRFPDDQALVNATVDRFVSEKQGSMVVPQDDRYEFLREIDRGGAAIVWRVYDRHLKRSTAVKLLLESQNSSEMRQRLELEARLCGRLQHPGIVPVHELSRLEDGRPFITMKLVEGQTLAEMLESDPPRKLSTLLNVFHQATVAVAYAHEQGVIHRDLKPANIMVGEFDEVQVMDWGLSKELGASEKSEPALDSSDTMDSHLTLNGSVFGTLAYMSPEQARGEVDRIDKRSDVFALGAMLFRIVTGETIYGTADSTRLQNIAARGDLSDAMGRLRRVRGSSKLKSLIRDCLAVQPSDRPANAGEVVKQLQRCLKPRMSLRRIAISCFLGFAVFVIFEMSMVTEIDVIERPEEPSVNVPVIAAKTFETEAVEKREAEKVAAEKREAEKVAAEKREAEKVAAEKREAEKVAAEKREAEKVAAEKREAEKVAAEKREAEKVAAEKVAAELAKAEEEEVGSLLREVSDLISARDLIPAEQTLKTALLRFPGNTQLTQLLVDLLLRLHKPDDAVALCREFRSERRNRNEFYVRSQLGASMRHHGQLAEAEALALEQIQINKGHPLSHFELSMVRFQQGRFAEAVQSINRCAELKPAAPGWKRDVGIEIEQFRRSQNLHDELDDYLQRDDDDLSLEDCEALAIVCDLSGNIKAAIRFYRAQLSKTIAGGGRITLRYNMKLLGDFVCRYLNSSDTTSDDRRHLFEFGAEQLQTILPGVRYEVSGSGQQLERGRSVAIDLCDDPRLTVLQPETPSDLIPAPLHAKLSTAWQELRAIAGKTYSDSSAGSK